jgi:predicted ATP-grasp superfamily ATP-dependent carboligase
LKVFVFEYFAAGTEENQALKQAGYAMLKAVLQDFAAIPGIAPATILDSSLKGQAAGAPYLQGATVCWREAGEDGVRLFGHVLSQCDAVLIIAPETAGILAKLTALAESQGKTVLGSSSPALAITCNKARTLSLLAEKGLPVPRSAVFKPPAGSHKAEILEAFSYPLVLKPAFGAGGIGVRRVETEEQLDKALAQWPSTAEACLVQEYIRGRALSVSLFILNGRALPLSLNRQILKNGEELTIRGIAIPAAAPANQAILATAVKACEQVQGLRGFTGVDLVLGSGGPVLIEINSRITLAYAALREVVSRNLAGDLLRLCLENRLPPRPEIQGRYTYCL